MDIKDVNISEIKPYLKNPRKIPEEAVNKVAASLKEFGFRQPIVVDKNMEIVAGHTRLLAAKKLGLDVVPVHIAQNLTESQIKAYRLADNKVAEFSDWDDPILDAELDELLNLDFDMSEFGFELPEIEIKEEPAEEEKDALENKCEKHMLISKDDLVPPDFLEVLNFECKCCKLIVKNDKNIKEIENYD